MRARGMEMASKDCVKVAVRVRPFNKVSTARLSKKNADLCLNMYLGSFVALYLEVLFNKLTMRLNHSFETWKLFLIQRERDAGSRCIISMTSNNISIQDPRNLQNSRTFTFDYTYWSHSGFSRNKDGLFVPEETGGRYADQVTHIRLNRGCLTLHKRMHLCSC